MHEIPASATGKLRDFAEAGMIGLADYHLARRMSRGFETDEDVVLAFALAVRELRLGSVCLVLDDVRSLKPDTDVDDGSVGADPRSLDWPDGTTWPDRIAASPLVGPDRPFILDDGRLYLARFHAQERAVAEALARRRGLPLDDFVAPLPNTDEPDAQQDAAVVAAMRHRTAVVTGGPGTGKTTTVVRILNSLAQAGPLRIALAAPTGKAARQLHDAVMGRLRPGASLGEPFSGTLHRLLGKSVRGPRAVHDADNPLPHDVVVLDEVSMVSLEHMASLLAALTPATRLLLVGDPHQLRSVEAGAVLADIVANPGLLQSGSVVELATNRRSNQEIAALARAIHDGDASRALELVDAARTIAWYDYDGEGVHALGQFRSDVTAQVAEVASAAARDDARAALDALGRHRVLCAHRLGPFGVQGWARAAREMGAEIVDGYGRGEHYVGQPLLVTHNSDTFSNGDVAVIVASHGALLAAVDQGPEPLRVAPVLLDNAVDLHAMTIHKAQGGSYDRVSVVLPPADSPLATRELLYTAVTRARKELRIYGTRRAFLQAIATPVRRASGLAG